ncbi:hexokinase-like isoform X2 [Tubulanus polymorphus]|uniref:hexokinase-like isoform X2 n=1 Tax=Tubulanus polymorphus TaxID=672921 RepID=UPI003DA54BBE
MKILLEIPPCETVETFHKDVDFTKLDDLTKELLLTDETYERVMRVLDEEMTKGLGKETNADAVIKMFPTYVHHLPDGTEQGNFLALDLGGSNFRVLLIVLHGKSVEMKSRIYSISDDLKTGVGEKLFDHIADCIARFMEENNLKGMQLPLGFTFSFPCKQHGLSKATLVKWTKGFSCEGVENEDIVKLLHAAIDKRKDIDVECLAVINDTVGTLMACAHKDQNCKIGLILGTGTNACYVEKLDRVELWDGETDVHEQVIINTEWGAFGDNDALDFVRTKFDRDIDSSSIRPGKQVFEKMISGMYMGEIARRAIVNLIDEHNLLQGELTLELSTRDRFYTKYVSEIESDVDGRYKITKNIFRELGYDDIDAADCRTVQYVCSLVSARAAYLSSAGIAAIINRINSPEITVAIDGSLYRFHPKFRDLMMEKIEELINPGIKFKLELSTDGSGKGAALVAAVAYRMKMQQLST